MSRRDVQRRPEEGKAEEGEVGVKSTWGVAATRKLCFGLHGGLLLLKWPCCWRVAAPAVASLLIGGVRLTISSCRCRQRVEGDYFAGQV